MQILNEVVNSTNKIMDKTLDFINTSQTGFININEHILQVIDCNSPFVELISRLSYYISNYQDFLCMYTIFQICVLFHITVFI